MEKTGRQYPEKVLEQCRNLFESKQVGSLMEAARIIKQRYPDIVQVTPDSFRRTVAYYIRKKRGESHPALAEYCEDKGIPLENVKNYWDKQTKEFSVFLSGNDVITYEDIRDDIIEEMKQYSPIYPIIARDEPAITMANSMGHSITDPHLLVVDPADVHIGKLSRMLGPASEYDMETAISRVHEGVRGLLHKASGYHIDRILLVIGNDILHTDNTKRSTTSGTPQDTDGMWYENYKIAKKLYIDIIEMLLTVADVHVVFNPSNHDYMSGFFLSDTVATWFHNCSQVSFDIGVTHRKYVLYGNSLIGTTHGDGARGSRLAQLMPEEAPKRWADSKHRYWYTHHVHHKDGKDHGSVTIESLRSVSGTDMWHHIKGFCNQPKAIEGFLHDMEHGQVARLTHIFH